MQFSKIKSVEALEKYKLKVSFSDGIHGVYDVSDIAEKEFSKFGTLTIISLKSL